MYHCPECTTVLMAVEGATRADSAHSSLYLETLAYNCPGCGKQFLHRLKAYAERDPTDEWYHVVADRTLLMHSPPNY